MQNKLGGTGGFTNKEGRDIDGVLPDGSWYEAKTHLDDLVTNPKRLSKFKSQIGQGAKVAKEEGKKYILIVGKKPPKEIRRWLKKKKIPYKVVK